MTTETPVWDKDAGSWSVPEGYAHPKCRGCGHNYYGVKPRPMVDGRAPDGGQCHWCAEEEE